LTENFNDKIQFRKIQSAGYFRQKHNIKPSWSGYDLGGDMILLDDRSRSPEFFGCFKANGQIEDPITVREIMEITEKFKDTDTVVDVGAHIGLMSLAVRHGKVKAFEPTPETYDVLKNNAVINEWKQIEPVLGALSDKEVSYKIKRAFIKDEPWPGMNRIVEDVDGKSMTWRLDSFLDKLDNVKLIKVDTETCDLKVLKGATKLLDRDKPMLITEHVKKSEPYLINKGYKVIKRVGPINLLWGAK